MNVGDRVKVTARGAFHGCTGEVVRVVEQRRYRHRRRTIYWIVLPDHPWQKDGLHWGFDERELLLLTSVLS